MVGQLCINSINKQSAQAVYFCIFLFMTNFPASWVYDAGLELQRYRDRLFDPAQPRQQTLISAAPA